MQGKTKLSLPDDARRITYRAKGRMRYFRSLPIAERSAAFNVLSPRLRQEILDKLSFEESVELLDHLDVRRAHHILDRMRDARRRSRIIKRLKNDAHEKIEVFLRFHPQATIDLLHLNYVFLFGSTTIGETADIIEDYLRNTGKIPEVLVSGNGSLVGEVPLDALVREPNTKKLKTLTEPVRTISYTAPREEIISLYTTLPHGKTAVLDRDGSVLGIVYSDDVLDMLGASPESSLYSFAGVEEGEYPTDGILQKVRRRYRWLILNLGTAFLAAGVVALFEDTLSRIVLLAIYMPIIAGMGGNAATQTLAVMVRGITMGEVSLRTVKGVIVKEVAAGFFNGLITGGLVAIIAAVFNKNPMFGVVVGIAVVANLMIAGLAGALVPLLLKRIGKDPATSATIFITTATDVLGFFILLGLASVVLR